jgi:Holliday junction DNA helicase RuvA
LETTDDGAVVEVGGLGYAVTLSASTRQRLPAPGVEVRLLVVESTAMYGGGTTFYGFLTTEERGIYHVLRDNVPGAGAKKALELLDKAAKSLPDFRRAVIAKDTRSLVTLFGFTAKTAEKIVAALQGKLDDWTPAGPARFAPEGPSEDGGMTDVVAALVALGYRADQAREAAESARRTLGEGVGSASLIREGLRHLAGRG